MSLTVLDNMEYGSDAAAQAAYVSNGLCDGIEILVIAGGGGGGGGGSTYANGGGGGAGGLIHKTDYRVAVADYAVVIGSGGNGAGNYASPGQNGENSSFGTLIAIGGGGGCGWSGSVGSTGGSGGGGGGYTSTSNIGRYGTNEQGYNGGNGTNSANSNGSAGGGGGSGGAGNNNSTSTGGAGGNGTSLSISGTNITYAGGGGGGGTVTGGAGKANGGNGGSGNVNGSSASANTGSGGGGGGGAGSGGGTSGGNGGSGIVIVRYKTSQYTATGGTVTTDGEYTVHTFLDDGTLSVTEIPSDLFQGYSEPSIISEGAYSLKAIAAQTTSLNKTLTRTISSPINLTGYDYIIGKIRSTRAGSNVKIGLRKSIGSDILSGGTASADSTGSGSGAESAGCDNSTSTIWFSQNTAFPHWWKYDLGSGVTKAVTSVGICQHNNGGCIVKNFTIEGSNNNSDWTVIYTGTANNIENQTWEYFYFTNTTAYRYYRIVGTNTYRTTDNYFGFYEIHLSESGYVDHEVTPNITSAGTWQTIQFDISAVSDANKDAIDQIIITIVNADYDTTFYLDMLWALSGIHQPLFDIPEQKTVYIPFRGKSRFLNYEI